MQGSSPGGREGLAKGKQGGKKSAGDAASTLANLLRVVMQEVIWRLYDHFENIPEALTVLNTLAPVLQLFLRKVIQKKGP